MESAGWGGEGAKGLGCRGEGVMTPGDGTPIWQSGRNSLCPPHLPTAMKAGTPGSELLQLARTPVDDIKAVARLALASS